MSPTPSPKRPAPSRLPLLATLAWITCTAALPARSQEPQRGPFWSGTIMRTQNEPVATKALAVTLGADRKAYVAYDLDTLRLALAWTGEFLEFGNTLTKIEWPPPPRVKGDLAFSTAAGPGWSRPGSGGDWADPRPEHQGPLPKDWAHHRGVHVHGDRVVLRYTVGDVEILETPGIEVVDGVTFFTRTLEADRDVTGLTFAAFEAPDGAGAGAALTEGRLFRRTTGWRFASAAGGGVVVRFSGGRATCGTDGGQVTVTVARLSKGKPFRVAFARVEGDAVPDLKEPMVSPSALTQAGPGRWGEPIVTQGRRGEEPGAYQVDVLTEPFPNKYGVSTFFGGFDFLPDGRAAICTFHGDVWLVSGIDDTLGELRWQRYATGLFQPLGVKVVDGKVYVAGRDQITRLHDLNRDGEADYYENFNNDTVVTPNYHEFVLDLHTDPQGNFYYAKGAPWEPKVTSPHQGTILKVSPDGGRMEVFASGLRAPNGMTVGPDGTVLVGDNQGHWMPSSKLNLVKPGAFLGMVPAAQREMTLRYPDGRELKVNPSDPAAREAHGLKGWDKEMPIPASYDEPICWLPMRWDNSSGGQVYVDSDKWGPWKGSPLFMSYGKCLLYGVLMDEVDGTVQASMVPFGLKFASGVMRARFNPKDGQLYLCGLKGWQNAATRDGGFYRVRYTGAPVHLPVAARTAANGIELRFSDPLDAASAGDMDNYAVEIWNYRYSGAYGSPELSVQTPGKNGHDKLPVTRAVVASDRRSVLLEVEGLQPADQYSVRYGIRAADGTELRSEVIGTIHKLRPSLSVR